jgi:hypothetical protein
MEAKSGTAISLDDPEEPLEALAADEGRQD